MQVSAVESSAMFYAVSFTLYQLTAEQTFSNPASVMLWVFIVLAHVRSDHWKRPIHRAADPGYRIDS